LANSEEWRELAAYWLAGAGQFRFLFELLNRVRPKDHIDVPETGAAFTLFAIAGFRKRNSNIQTVYLTELPQPLAEVLIGSFGREAALMNERAP
jgi:hypothetical protein